ncbi:MAG: hotdog domain-containing protein [Actinomycetota bacterium]
MIEFIEMVCLHAVAPSLDDGETTVGVHICVSHEKPAALGDHIDVSCRLAEVNGRRLRFDVTVENERGRISEGTHDRVVVRETFGKLP